MHILLLILSLMVTTMLKASDAIDLSPQGFMARLRADEAYMAKKMLHKKDKFHSDASVYVANFILKLMEQYETDFYFPYLQALAKAKISNKMKIDFKCVMIPFFARLCEKSQEQQVDVVDSFVQERFALHYALWRLCLAALSHAVDLPTIKEGCYSDYILCTAIDQEDASLVRLLLANGANANGVSKGYSTLWWCKRKKEAQLLMTYKADIIAQHARNDLIEALCAMAHDNKQELELLEFFLSSNQELRNESNRFGRVWLETLASSLYKHRYLCDASICAEKSKLLLRFGHYEAEKDVDSGEPVGSGSFLVDSVISNYLTRNAPSRLVYRAIAGKPYLGIRPVAMKKRMSERTLEHVSALTDQD